MVNEFVQAVDGVVKSVDAFHMQLGSCLGIGVDLFGWIIGESTEAAA